MKKAVFTFIFLFILLSYTDAQLWKMRRFESSFGLGPSQLFGDIGGKGNIRGAAGFLDLKFSRMRYQFNGDLRFRVTQDISARLSLTYAGLTSSDAKGSNVERGYESSTSILETALLGEYYFIKNKAESSYLFSKGQRPSFRGIFKSLDFYAFTGFGGASFNVKPNAKLNLLNQKSSGFTPVVPVGIGTCLVFSPNLNFGAELGGRFSFTDYLDGYSSTYSKSNDVYYFLNFTVTYKLKTGLNGLPSFRK
jgi:hypothetical protein